MVVNLCLGKNASSYPAKICAFHLKRKVKKKRNGLTKQPYLVSRRLTIKKKKPIRMVQGGEGRGGGLRRKYIKQEPVVRAGAQSNKCLLNEYPVKRKARPRTRPSSQ